MTQYGFYFDNSRCTGCRTCEMACKDKKDLGADVAFRRIFDYEGGTCSIDAAGLATNASFAYHLSMACNHCTSPACVANCPQGAVHKDADTGLVLPNDDKCIGCGMCVKSCPYGVPHVDETKGKMVKCDGCYDRVTAGKKPICVDACPLRALEFDDIDVLKKAHADASGPIAPMPESKTVPNLIIKTCPAAKPVGDTTGSVINLQEVTMS